MLTALSPLILSLDGSLLNRTQLQIEDVLPWLHSSGSKHILLLEYSNPTKSKRLRIYSICIVYNIIAFLKVCFPYDLITSIACFSIFLDFCRCSSCSHQCLHGYSVIAVIVVVDADAVTDGSCYHHHHHPHFAGSSLPSITCTWQVSETSRMRYWSGS